MRLARPLIPVLGCLLIAACSQPAPPTPEPTAAPEATPVAPSTTDAGAPPADAAPADAQESRDSRAEAALSAYLAQEGAEPDPKHRKAFVDLDGDGNDDLLVYLEDPYFCGSGGCTLLVFRDAGADYALVNAISVTRSPVAVGEAGPNGWRDLHVSVAGGGGPSGTVRLAYDGTGYPTNPTVEPVSDTLPAEARIVID